jgi:hypothetical protein
LWSYAKYEYESYDSSLGRDYVQSWQITKLYRKDADCENVFDKLKNQWDFNGICCRYLELTENAARLLLVAHNTWNLFLGLLKPKRHVEAKHGRSWFFYLNVFSQISALANLENGHFWTLAANLIQGYQRLLAWPNLTAPQLKNIQANAPIKTVESMSICRLTSQFRLNSLFGI